VAEEKICMLNDTLERRIAERAAQLERRNRQLQRLALDLAEAEERERQNIASILYRSIKELLFNVVKHSGVLSAAIDVFCRIGMIHVWVEDSGKGFDYASVRSSQNKGGGCRVGLVVPKRLCSVSGSPLPSSEDMAGGCPAAEKTAAAVGPPDGMTPIRILMVDDHQLMREALAKPVHGYGWLTVAGQAANGLEAIELTERLQPDIVLMDVSMPEVDGIQATAEILRHHPGTRIIGLSMQNDRNSRQKMFEAGASAYLTKTGSPDVLVETIRRIHDARHGTDSKSMYPNGPSEKVWGWAVRGLGSKWLT
jgi:CheY-like chemotaxis protein